MTLADNTYWDLQFHIGEDNDLRINGEKKIKKGYTISNFHELTKRDIVEQLFTGPARIK